MSGLFTAPTAFRAIKREDPRGALIKNYDLSFGTLFLAGERLDPDTPTGPKTIFEFPLSITVANRNGLADLREQYRHGHFGGEGGLSMKPVPGMACVLTIPDNREMEAERHRYLGYQAASAAWLVPDTLER